jgi:hypothetical protein
MCQRVGATNRRLSSALAGGELRDLVTLPDGLKHPDPVEQFISLWRGGGYVSLVIQKPSFLPGSIHVPRYNSMRWVSVPFGPTQQFTSLYAERKVVYLAGLGSVSSGFFWQLTLVGNAVLLVTLSTFRPCQEVHFSELRRL